MLTDMQNIGVNRASRLELFLTNDANPPIYKTYVPFKKKVDAFLAKYAALQPHIGNKQIRGEDITLTKEELRESLSKKWSDICSITSDYALETNNDALHAAVHIFKSDLLNMPEQEILPLCANLSTNVFTAALLATPAFMEYKITAAQIADALADATAFNGKIGKARVVQSEATVASAAIDDLLKGINKDVDGMDRLINHFENNNIGFALGYHANSSLDKAPRRHSGIQGIVEKNGVPQAGVLVMIVGTNRTAITDANGRYSIITIRPGNYTIQAKNANGDTDIKTFHIRKAHIDTLDFVLQ